MVASVRKDTYHTLGNNVVTPKIDISTFHQSNETNLKNLKNEILNYNR